MDRVRQAGREVYSQPIRVFLDIDLEVVICIEPSAYFGQVQERVIRALTGPARYGEPRPFFDPDNFSFGDPLYRAELEAAIAMVPGVLAVEEIRLRRRGQADFTVLTQAALEVGSDRILRLANDPRKPEQGSLRVLLHAQVTPYGGGAMATCPCDKCGLPILDIPAGLDRLPRQLGGFPEFRKALLAGVALKPALDGWRAREGDDFGLMILEWWAYVLDVLAFYSGEIANELYLRTGPPRRLRSAASSP